MIYLCDQSDPSRSECGENPKVQVTFLSPPSLTFMTPLSLSVWKIDAFEKWDWNENSRTMQVLLCSRPKLKSPFFFLRDHVSGVTGVTGAVIHLALALCYVQYSVCTSRRSTSILLGFSVWLLLVHGINFNIYPLKMIWVVGYTTTHTPNAHQHILTVQKHFWTCRIWNEFLLWLVKILVLVCIWDTCVWCTHNIVVFPPSLLFFCFGI